MRSIVFAVLGVVILAAVCVSYAAVEARIDRERFPEQGKLVDVGGYKLNINCNGEGSPTVVLEAGLASFSFTWQRVQSEIAKFTRVCSYDRAGYAWSDAGPPPRTSQQIARELHTLLQHAQEKPPYVLVGHSFGGLNVRAFNGLYPSEVAGMVLVESSHPDLLERLPPSIKKESDDAQKQRERQGLFAPFLYDLGISRFISRKEIEDTKADYLSREYADFSLQPKFIDAVTGEAGALEESGAEVRASRTLGDKPLIVLTAGKGVMGMPVQGQDLLDFYNIWVNDLQVQLAGLSTRGKRIMVPDSDHMIPYERPDAVVTAVRDVCDTVEEH